MVVINAIYKKLYAQDCGSRLSGVKKLLKIADSISY